jgi:acetoin utilization deacetylase AcuC-like enzyme
MKLFYNDDYVASRYAFDTTRKSQHIIKSLYDDPVENLEIYDPHLFTDETKSIIQRIHTDDYVNALQSGKPRNLAESQGFDWDEGIWTMAVAHSSGLVGAIHYALGENTLTGSLSSGLHHARRGMGGGFCTVNGLAVAARHALDMEASRVLVLDFDAHGGGGTWDIIKSKMPSVTQIDVVCSLFDTYEPSGESAIWEASAANYSDQIERALEYAETLAPFDVIIYNAGMDPLNSGVDIEDIIYREAAVRSFIGNTPAVFALAGGYTWGKKSMDDVVSWHRLTIEQWAGE